VVGYAAAHLGRWHVDRGLLLRCLALYTIFNAVVNLVTRQGIWDKARGTCPPSADLCRALECLGRCGRLAVQLICQHQRATAVGLLCPGSACMLLVI